MPKEIEHYDGKEAQKRFEAALRGARIAGSQHKQSVTPNQAKAQSKKPKAARLVIAVMALVAFSYEAKAECTCECVNGHVQPLCESSIDLPPLCPPTLCPLMSPSLAPLNPPTLPPLGTSECHQARICDQFGNCRWQQVCQ
jgi:hypothetical protein